MAVEFSHIAHRAHSALTRLRAYRADATDGRGTGRYLSVADVAERTGCDRAVINAWVRTHPELCRKGRLPWYAVPLLHHARNGSPAVQRTVIAVVQHKGGSGKSTLATHLAHAFATRGLRSVVIDADPQASASLLMGCHPDRDVTASDTLCGLIPPDARPLDALLRPVIADVLAVLPANLAVAGVDVALMRYAADRVAYWDLLGDALAASSAWDVVLIDCPPTLSYLTVLGVHAADTLLIPLRPSLPDVASTAQLFQMLDEQLALTSALAIAWGVSHRRRQGFRALNLVWTQTRGSTAESEVARLAERMFDGLFLPISVPYSSAIITAGAHLRTVYDISRRLCDGRSADRAIAAFDAIADHLLKEVLHHDVAPS